MRADVGDEPAIILSDPIGTPTSDQSNEEDEDKLAAVRVMIISCVGDWLYRIALSPLFDV